MEYGPLIRIALRYLVGATIVGSVEFGEHLAADPDLVAVLALAVGAAVEAYYAYAKRKGKAT